jgi:hypothetical protein
MYRYVEFARNPFAKKAEPAPAPKKRKLLSARNVGMAAAGAAGLAGAVRYGGAGLKSARGARSVGNTMGYSAGAGLRGAGRRVRMDADAIMRAPGAIGRRMRRGKAAPYSGPRMLTGA